MQNNAFFSKFLGVCSPLNVQKAHIG